MPPTLSAFGKGKEKKKGLNRFFTVKKGRTDDCDSSPPHVRKKEMSLFQRGEGGEDQKIPQKNFSSRERKGGKARILMPAGGERKAG